MQIYSYLHPTPNTHTLPSDIKIKLIKAHEELQSPETHASQPPETHASQPQLIRPISVPATLASILSSSEIHASSSPGPNTRVPLPGSLSLLFWPGKYTHLSDLSLAAVS